MKSAAKCLWICALITGMSFMLITATWAQTYTATVTGTVSDPQGAVAPKVKVVAINQGTKLEYNAQTSDSGVYTIPFLPVGLYVLSVEASGFKKLVSNEIKLEVNQTARIDLQLQVGAVNEIVNIADVAPVLQTESVTVGNVITGDTTTALPLNGRNFNQLTLLVPGSITPNPGSFTTVNPASAGQRPYVNGNREQGNAFLLDGISVDETIDNRIGYKPNVDAIAEFRVETSNSSSEFGNVTGATVNATLKSGTNSFHGNAFEFLRNDALDANEWASNRNGQKKSKLRQNIFGGTLGGPVLKNKLFFFVDYQGTLQRTGGPGTATVAPAAWRTGDLSSLAGIVRDPTKCVDPKTISTCEPFAGNKIPLNRISNPVAKALFADTNLYPLPVRIAPGSGLGLIDVITASQLDGHQFDFKLDARLSEKDNITGRYSFANIENADVKGSLPTNITGKGFSRPQNIMLNWTRAFSPTVINEARVGLNRALFISDFNDWAGIGAANAKLGIPGSQAIAGISSITMGNGLSIGSLAINEDNVTNTFHYGDNLTLLRGRHTLKMGGQLQRYQQNRYYPGNNGLLGGFTYSGIFTGVAFGDFLLDQLQSKSIGSQTGTWGHRQIRLGFFFQDDYKVRNNLTINLGLRWEYTSPVVEVKDRQSNFDLKTGKQLFAGKDGNSRALYDPYYKGFEPRLGIAWTPNRFNNKLVVRAGYGITQFMEGTGSNLRLPLNPPFFVESNVAFSNQSGPGTITKGFTDVVGLTAIQGLIRIWNPKLRPQFTQQYNLTFEYQLTGATSVSAAYVGHNATHLVAPTDDNQALPDPGPVSGWRPIEKRRPFSASLPLVGGTQSTDSWSISNYNALQLSVRQRKVKGFDYLLSYTLSKTLTDNRGFYGSGGVAAQFAYAYDSYNRRADYGPAFFDALHNFSWSGTYELPLGKGRSFGSDMHPAANIALGGWNISSIVSAHTGFPITVVSNDLSEQGISRSTAAQGRPLLVGNPKPANQTIDNWLNLSAFIQPERGRLGNAGVGIVRAPGYVNLDFGVGKKFNLTESRYFDFRAEFFNFTNHPSFSPPGRTTADLNTFGKITSTVSNARRVEFALKFFF